MAEYIERAQLLKNLGYDEKRRADVLPGSTFDTGCSFLNLRREITMLDLYIKYRGGTPYQYRYGDGREAMRLFIDGGYSTPEEAKKAWEDSFGKHNI